MNNWFMLQDRYLYMSKTLEGPPDDGRNVLSTRCVNLDSLR